MIPTTQPREGQALEAALQECMRELEAGRPLGAEQVRARWPELAEPLLGCLEALAFVQQAGADVRPADAARIFGNEPLGDFRIVREVGRGGMGVVYEAEQISLGRRVALKVLPFAAALDPRQFQRFRQEAHAAACLTHPHIVPVFGVGCERGVHYYAMQFVDGQPLTELVRARRQEAGLDEPPDALATTGPFATPTTAGRATPRPGSTGTREDEAYFRRVAELGAQAADALQHAHDYGIIHRDVKPGNLMLDGTGKLWVTDFGLARLERDANLTRTGDILGTARYMSPEQAQGLHSSMDHRSDVYSLGVTLYELLTLRPAVPGDDRMEVLRKIVEEDPVSPRSLVPSIPVDLETVVLKAMSKEPSERYQNAGELAADLRRFLADEAIQARRPTWDQTVKRLVRRYPVLVLTVATAAVLLLSGVVAWLAYKNGMEAEVTRVETRRADEAEQHNHELTAAIIKRDEAMVQEKAYRGLAWKAADDMYVKVVAEVLPLVPQQEGLQRKLLENAISVYEKLLQAGPAAYEDHYRLALAEARLAKLNFLLLQGEEGMRWSQSAQKRLEGLLVEKPYDKKALGLLSLVWGDRDRQVFVVVRGGSQEAVDFRRKSHDIFLKAYEAHKADPRVCVGMAQRKAALAEALRLAGQPYRPFHDEARRILLAVVKECPDDPIYAMNLITLLVGDRGPEGWSNLSSEDDLKEGMRRLAALKIERVKGPLLVHDMVAARSLVLHNLGSRMSHTGRPAEGERYLRQALAFREKAFTVRPLHYETRQELALTLGALSFALKQQGKDYGKESQRACALLDDMLRDFPDSQLVHLGLSANLSVLGDWLWQAGDNAGCADCYRRCYEANRVMQRRWPKITKPWHAAEAANKVAVALMAQPKKLSEAVRWLDISEEGLVPHMGAGATASAWATLVQCRINRGLALQQRDFKRATRELALALKTIDRAEKALPGLTTRLRVQKGTAQANLASFQWKAGNKAEARKLLKAACEVLSGVVERKDRPVEALATLGKAWALRSAISMLAGDNRAACEEARQAVLAQRKAFAISPHSRRYASDLRQHLLIRFRATYRRGDHAALEATGDELWKTFSTDWNAHYQAAQIYGYAHSLAGKDAALSSEARQARQVVLSRKFTEAIDRASELARTNAVATADLAYFLVHIAPVRLRDPGRGYALAQRASSIQPGLRLAAEVSVLAHYRAGRHAQGVAAAALARLRFGSGVAIAEYAAAMCHARLGEADKAKERLKAADEARSHTKPITPFLVALAGEAHAVVKALPDKGP
jgi:serine/threonine protein kinase